MNNNEASVLITLILAVAAATLVFVTLVISPNEFDACGRVCGVNGVASVTPDSCTCNDSPETKWPPLPSPGSTPTSTSTQTRPKDGTASP